LWPEVTPAVTLRGRITLNTKRGEGLANVQVQAPGHNPVFSVDSGYFEKDLPGVKPGDSMNLVVHKEGLELVNGEALKILFRNAPVTEIHIVMCKRGERTRWASLYYEIDLTGYVNTSFEEKLAEAMKRFHKDAQKLRAELNRINKEKEVALTLAKKLAEQLATNDLDQASGLYREAVEYVKRGELDKAFQVLDDVKIEAAANQARKVLRNSVDAFLLKAHIAVFKFQFNSADAFYRKAIGLDPGNFNSNVTYAYYLFEQTRYKKALELYQRALSLADNDDERSTALNELGILYWKSWRFKDAELAYKNSLAIKRALEKKYPGTYLKNIAHTLSNLGNLYMLTERYPDSERVYNEALTIQRKLAEKYPGAFEADIAMTIDNLGILYSQTGCFADAEKAYKEALVIRRTLDKKYPGIYIESIANTLNNLGNLYKWTKRFPDSERVYNEALTIRKNLAQKNPGASEPYLARILDNLGVLFLQTNRYTEAEEIFKEALTIRRALAKRNPDAFRVDVTVTLDNLASLYKITGRVIETETMLREALTVRKAQAEKNPAAFLPSVAANLNHLGMLYINMKKFPEAKDCFTKALAIREKLPRTKPVVYDLDLCDTLIPLSILMLRINRSTEGAKEKAKAIALLNRAISILKKYPNEPRAKVHMKALRDLANKKQ
jgi:tetratricopeptide (TPR) repeat protein